MKVFLFLILFNVASPVFSADNVCDSKKLLNFKINAQCWDKNNPQACEAVPLLAGSTAAAALHKKASMHPDYKELSEFLKKAQTISDKLAKDYQALLKTYYDLKKKSANPQFDKPQFQFTYEEYKKFQSELRKAHPNNLFIEKFEEYGHGRADDIFQRTAVYAMDGQKSVDVNRFLKTFQTLMSLDADRMHIIYREASVNAGYPENGNLKFVGQNTRSHLKSKKNQVGQSITEDLNIEKNRLKSIGIQTGKVAPELLVGLAGTAAALTPFVDLHTSLTYVKDCSKQLSVNLTEEQIIEIAKAVEKTHGLTSTKSACEKFHFTEDGVKTLFATSSFHSDLQQFLCSYNDTILTSQIKIDESTEWDIQNCGTASSKTTKTYFEIVKPNEIEITTSSGIPVNAKLSSLGEWDYYSLTSSNIEFNNYLMDKIRHPFSVKSVNSKSINPKLMCDGRETGRLPQAFCEMSKAMRGYSELKATTAEICKTRDTKTNVPTPQKASHTQ